MKRVLVVGAGFFGRLVARRLAEVGCDRIVAARRSGEVHLDAEDEASLRGVLRRGDVVIDTAGPFIARSPRLVRVAAEVGCDVIDLAETLAWSTAILALEQRVADGAVRVYPACSAVAAVVGACVRASGIAAPERVDVFLAPASAETASPAAVRGFIGQIGRPIRTLRGGRLVTVRGYAESCVFPVSGRRGGLVESAAAVLLPRSWPTLRRADFWVDPNALFARSVLSVAAAVPPLAALMRALVPRVGAGPFGRHAGVFAVVVRDATNERTFTFTSPRRSYLVAVEPAVLAAERLVRGDAPPPGVILPDAQVDPGSLFARLRALGIAVEMG